jgi:TPP-dependent pyruvate/acetoin dehydrogenase alpha subunit
MNGRNFLKKSDLLAIIIGLFPNMSKRLNELNCLSIYQMMQLIRQTELGIAARYSAGEMRCPTHLSVGQECIPAVLSQLLDFQDLAVSTHRSHAHYLGKGGCLKSMLAEIYGKATGCSKGRGGSMHLIDQSVGFKGSTAIVGNTIPIGVGLALAKKIKQESGISVVFLGDGAIEEGVFYESANFAATQKLPVIFVCENNLYSVYSDLSVRQPKGRRIYELAQAIGLNSHYADGNDVLNSFNVLSSAIAEVRNGRGPAFVELSTYRWLEHCGPNFDNDIGYRSEQEFLKWKEKDPILCFENALYRQGIANKAQLSQICSDVSLQVEDAFDFAQNSAFPEFDKNSHQVFARNPQ